MDNYRDEEGEGGGGHPDMRWIEKGRKRGEREWGRRKREDDGEAEANLSILEAPDRQTDRQQFAFGGNGFH